MGNWRTVSITGSMNARDAASLYEYLGYSYAPKNPAMDHFGPLSFNRDQPSLCGLNNWVNTTVNACGNLAERNYSVEDVAEERQHRAILPGSPWFSASWPGKCSGRGEPIQPGDRIRADGHGTYVCEDCGASSALEELF